MLRDASDHRCGCRDLGVLAELEHNVTLAGEDGLCQSERRGTGVETAPSALEALEEADDLAEVDGSGKVGLEQGLGAGVERSDDLALGLGLLEDGVGRRQDADLESASLSLESKGSRPPRRGRRAVIKS